MNFTFKVGDKVQHVNMGLVELEVTKVFPLAKHIVWIAASDGQNYRALTTELIRLARPSEDVVKSNIAIARLHRKTAKEEFAKMVAIRQNRFKDHVAAGGRLKADGTPDRRIKKLKRTVEGGQIIWIGRK